MFCPKCGKQIPDGSKFCCICGEKLAAAEPVVTVENTKAAVAVVKPRTEKVGGKVDIKKYIPMAAAAAGVLILLVLVISLFSGSGKPEYAYLSGGRYYLISDLKDAESLELAAAKSDSIRSGMLRFSPDGKYVCYFTKFDYYNETGTLCRARLDKLGNNPDKNEKHIEIIATNVRLGFTFLEDGSLLYTTGEDSLYHYNGKDVNLVARDVEGYFADEKLRVIYYTGDYREGYSLYGVRLKDLETKEKLDSNVSYLYDTWDLENILYVKNDDLGIASLYAGGFGKESQQLDEDVKMLDSRDGKTWYLAADGTLSLYDFVQDNYAAADGSLTEPASEDFEIPVYTYKKVYGSDLKEENFPELYTSVTRELTWFQDGWWYYSMEEAVDMDWGENSEALKTAIQAFIDKYADTADENGFILVTPEVKSALLEIQKCGDEPDNQWQWMWLCYNRQQTDTTTDWDAYNAAWEAWESAEDRVYMREALKNPENARKVYTIKTVEAGKAEVISENVLSWGVAGDGLIFNTADMVTEKPLLEDIYYLSDLNELFELRSDAQNQVLLLDSGKVVRFSASAADNIYMAAENGDTALYFTDKYAFLSEGNGTLSQAEIKDDQIGSFAVVTDDAQVVGLREGVLYYASGVYSNNGYDYCELHSLEGGKTSRLARDIMCYNITLYEDGTILAYTDSRGGYELTMISAKGESKLLSEGVSGYVRVDKNTLLILSGGDLFCYNGKSKTLVGVNVDQVWTQEKMDIKAIFY